MMKTTLLILSLLFLGACSGSTVHYDYASTTAKGGTFSYLHYPIATATPQEKTDISTQNSDFTFIKNPTSKVNDFALIIGITKYSNNPDVPYASRSAKDFSQLVQQTFGLPQENIITLLDTKATSGSVKSKLHLIKELADKDSTIYFYFAGHGLPSKDGDTYLLPSDMSADAIEYENNLKLTNIYKLLSNSLASKVVVVMDSCFSGKDDSGKLLYHGVAPVLKVKKAKATDKMTIFTAGGPKDFANALDSKSQRMFSYYFITAVNSGLKDVNAIYTFTRAKVKRASLHKGIGYKQIPQVDGKLKRNIY